MKLSDVERRSILNPIINEIGVVDIGTQDKIVTEIGIHLNRIINERISSVVETMQFRLANIEKELVSINHKISGDPLPEKEDDDVKKEAPVLEDLQKKSFKELVFLAQSLKIDVEPRMKREQIAELVLKELTNGW